MFTLKGRTAAVIRKSVERQLLDLRLFIYLNLVRSSKRFLS
jgi:hypothetical protein